MVPAAACLGRSVPAARGRGDSVRPPLASGPPLLLLRRACGGAVLGFRVSKNPNLRRASCVQRRPPAAGAGRDAGETGGIGVEGAPWSLLFDLRERETEWSAGNQGRLVTAFASEELGVSPEEVAHKLQDLCVLVPDLASRIDKLTPVLVVSLIQNTKEVARNIVALKMTFPKADLGKIAAAYPQILLKDANSVQQEAQKVAELLNVSELDTIVEQYPRILDAEAVQEALDMLKVILPDKDPRETLAASPSFMSRVERGDRRLGANPDPGSDHSLA